MSDWIPVSERLPETPIPCQVWSSFGYAYAFYLGEEIGFRDLSSGSSSGKYKTFNEEFGCEFEVSHWMPLPPPPQK